MYRGKPVNTEILVRLQAKPNRYEPGKGSGDGISWQDIELALQGADKKPISPDKKAVVKKAKKAAVKKPVVKKPVPKKAVKKIVKKAAVKEVLAKKAAPKKPAKKTIKTRAKLKRLMGRPSEIDSNVCTELCVRLIHFGSLRKVCLADDMPSKTTVFNWIAKARETGAQQIYIDFLDQYEMAKEMAVDYSFDELRYELEEIAMVPVMVPDTESGLLTALVIKGEVVKAPTSQSIAMANLHFNAYKWKSARENPKKYGDKIQQEHGLKPGTSLSIPMMTEYYVSPGDVLPSD
jgi:hypothetical protein